MTTKERDYAVDAVKGVLILCIALLHFENGYFPPRLNWWIGLFMVPGFYFMSGYLFSRKEELPKFHEFVRKRLVQLGWPYLTFVMLALFFTTICCLSGWLPWKIVLRECYKALVLHGVGPLWFLPVLFFSECIFVFITSRRHPVVLAIACVIVSLAVYYLYFSIWLPKYRNLSDAYRMLDAVIAPYAFSSWGWLVIGCGFIFGKYVRIDGLPGVWRVAYGSAAISISVVLMFINLHVPFLQTMLSNILPPVGMLLIFSIMGMPPIMRFLAFWGRHSLLVMCLHFTIFEEAFKILDAQLFKRLEFSGWPPLVYLAMTLIAIYFLVPVFYGKLRFMMRPL